MLWYSGPKYITSPLTIGQMAQSHVKARTSQHKRCAGYRWGVAYVQGSTVTNVSLNWCNSSKKGQPHLHTNHPTMHNSFIVWPRCFLSYLQAPSRPGSQHTHTVQKLLLPGCTSTLGAVKDTDVQKAWSNGLIPDLKSIWLNFHTSLIDILIREVTWGWCGMLEILSVIFFLNHQAVSLLPWGLDFFKWLMGGKKLLKFN